MDYEREDRAATIWGNAAVTFKGQKPSILDICVETHEQRPISEDDLAYLRTKCRAWGIACNMDGEPVWENARRWHEMPRQEQIETAKAARKSGR